VEKIRFPDNLEIENKSQTNRRSQWLIFSSDFKLRGKISPCYRFMLDLDNNVDESEFSIISMTGFPSLDSALKEIFSNETNVFGHYEHSLLYRFLVIDLPHFSWCLKNVAVKKTEVQVEIENEYKIESEKPIARVIGIFNDNTMKTQTITFNKKDKISIDFKKPLATCKVYLLANANIGFSG